MGGATDEGMENFAGKKLQLMRLSRARASSRDLGTRVTAVQSHVGRQGEREEAGEHKSERRQGHKEAATGFASALAHAQVRSRANEQCRGQLRQPGA